MENNFDNTPEDTGVENTVETPVYTDPNEGVENPVVEESQNPIVEEPQDSVVDEPQEQAQPQYEYNYAGQNTYQNTNQNPYQYDVGNNAAYNQSSNVEMDNSPLSMGDWILTILAYMIPCAGIILYFIWAFGKTGNVNRRNFCRAQLIITGVLFLIYVIFVIIFGVVVMRGNYYYY